MTIVARDFAPIVDRARAAGCALEVFGEVEGLPLLAARVGAGEPEALLNAGIHGDEPATVEAALHVVERAGSGQAATPGINVMLCINPTGYACGNLETAQGVDINWSWTRTDVPEIEFLRGFLSGRRGMGSSRRTRAVSACSEVTDFPSSCCVITRCTS